MVFRYCEAFRSVVTKISDNVQRLGAGRKSYEEEKFWEKAIKRSSRL